MADEMKGIYCLIAEMSQDTLISIGSLGKIRFSKGTYAYIGSAQNNLKKRLKRHISKEKRIRWHIDYLLNSPFVKISKILWKDAGKEEECRLACILSSMCDPVKGFGCSDCRCYSHLFNIRDISDLDLLGMEELAL